MIRNQRPARETRAAALLAALLTACCFQPEREPVDAGWDAGIADAGLGSSEGPDAGGTDAGLPLDGGGDGGLGDAGPWMGFGGTCHSLVAPLAWFADGGDVCPFPDGGTIVVNLLEDPDNCGACGLKCGLFWLCDRGRCQDGENGLQYECPTELPDGSIGTQGTNLDYDDKNCGGCNCPCPEGTQCRPLDPAKGDPTYVTPWGAKLPFAKCVPK